MRTEQKVPKGYKKTEVGVIPEDWGVVIFADHFDIIAGFGFKKEEYLPFGIKLLRIDNVSYGFIKWDTIAYLPMSYNNKHPKLILNENDIVFALNRPITNDKLKLAIIKYNDAPSILYQRVGKIIFLGEFYTKSYAYFILLTYIKEFVEYSSVGSDQPFISTVKLKQIKIPLPPSKTEQTAIANVLSDADALIQSLTRLIEKRWRIKEGAMQTLLNPYERGKLKKGWEFKTYGEIFDFLSTASYSRNELNKSEDYGYIHYGDIHTLWDGFLDLNRHTIPTISSQQARKYTIAKDGDLVVADASEDYNGVCKSIEIKNISNKSVIAGLHTMLLRDNKNVFIHGYRGYINQSQYLKNQFYQKITGLKVYGVSKGNLKLIKIPIPPLPEQTRIATILSDMDTEISALEAKLAKYRRIKQAMMQSLLTGKIRLTQGGNA